MYRAMLEREAGKIPRRSKGRKNGLGHKLSFRGGHRDVQWDICLNCLQQRYMYAVNALPVVAVIRPTKLRGT
jgi:hypothetical protein